MKTDIFIRLEALDYLIYSRSTGSPQKLAKRLCISERSLYNLLDIMRDLGAPICYCKTKQTYYYSVSGSISVRFQKVGPSEELVA